MWIVVFACTDIRHKLIDRHTYAAKKKITQTTTYAGRPNNQILEKERQKRNTSK